MIEIIWIVSLILSVLEIIFGEQVYSFLIRTTESRFIQDYAMMIPLMSLVVFSAAVIRMHL